MKVVHQEGVHSAAGLTAGPVAGGGGSSVPDTAGHQQRHGNEGDGGEGRIVEEEQCRHAQYAQDSHNALFGAIDEQSFHGSDILDDSGHQVTGGPVVDPAGGELLQPAIDLAADVEDDVLFEAVVEPDSQGVEGVSECEGRQESEDGATQLFFPPTPNHIVHHEAGQLGIGEGRQLPQEGADDGARGQQRIRPQVGGDATDDFPRGAGTDGKGSLCVAVDMGEVLHNDWMRTVWREGSKTLSVQGQAQWASQESASQRNRARS